MNNYNIPLSIPIEWQDENYRLEDEPSAINSMLLFLEQNLTVLGIPRFQLIRIPAFEKPIYEICIDGAYRIYQFQDGWPLENRAVFLTLVENMILENLSSKKTTV